MGSNKEIICECNKLVPNRFRLAVVAANYAKSLATGGRSIMDGKEKSVVVALRNIANHTVNIDELEESIISSYSSGTPLSVSNEKKASVLIGDIAETFTDASELTEASGFSEVAGIFADQNTDNIE